MFIYDMHHDEDFASIGDLSGCSRKTFETAKRAIFSLIYCLVELALVLPAATVSVKMVFPIINVVETDLCNKMGDEWISDSFVVYTKKVISVTIANKVIL